MFLEMKIRHKKTDKHKVDSSNVTISYMRKGIFPNM